ncbi:MAG: hypothetical protein ACPGJV_06160 [Bacteriovoracaceae bacterium]
MKSLFLVLMILISAKTFAVNVKDQTTINRIDRLRIKVSHQYYDKNSDSVKWSKPNGAGDAYVKTLNEVLDNDFDPDDYCIIRAYANTLKAVLNNVHFLNRMDITDIEIARTSGPSDFIDQRSLLVSVYSDPILKVEVGFKNDTDISSGEDYCKALSVEEIVESLEVLSRNY